VKFFVYSLFGTDKADGSVVVLPFEEQAKPFGAAQCTERLVLCRPEGRTRIGGLGLMRNGSRLYAQDESQEELLEDLLADPHVKRWITLSRSD